MKAKKPRESELKNQVILVNPSELNSDWSMHGGRLFRLLDEKAAIVAREHSGNICHTIAVSPFKYFKPITTGDEVIIDAKITRAWNTSMEIRVDAYVRAIGKRKKHAVSLYLYFVAVKDGSTQQVPAVNPVTKKEIEEYSAADARREWVKTFINEYITPPHS